MQEEDNNVEAITCSQLTGDWMPVVLELVTTPPKGTMAGIYGCGLLGSQLVILFIDTRLLLRLHFEILEGDERNGAQP